MLDKINILNVGNSISDYSWEPLDLACRKAVVDFSTTFEDFDPDQPIYCYKLNKYGRGDCDGLWGLFTEAQLDHYLKTKDHKRDVFDYFFDCLLTIWIICEDDYGHGLERNVRVNGNTGRWSKVNSRIAHSEYYWEI